VQGLATTGLLRRLRLAVQTASAAANHGAARFWRQAIAALLHSRMVRNSAITRLRQHAAWWLRHPSVAWLRSRATATPALLYGGSALALLAVVGTAAAVSAGPGLGASGRNQAVSAALPLGIGTGGGSAPAQSRARLAGGAPLSAPRSSSRSGSHQVAASGRTAAPLRQPPASRATRVHRAGSHAAQPRLGTWNQIQHAAAGVSHGSLPPADRLLPVSTDGPQSYLPMTAAREANAAVIVGQAFRLHMGIRSAVVAVATAMQESQLVNIGYGTYDSLGLFQQRPSMGWGTPAQIMHPAYASDAFLRALRQYQHADPGWASQPLYQAAQGVQKSAFPYAYARWEDQAAQVVAHVAKRMLG
jgi:hypothetical protein